MDGIVFDSKAEMLRYADLRISERIGLVRSLKLQVPFGVAINGQHFCIYTADFMYEEIANGHWAWVVEEVKSGGTVRERDYALRKKAAELYHRFTVREYMAT